MSYELQETDVNLEFNKEGDAEITILKGDDVGIRFKYGRVSLDENEAGDPSLSFGYEIISGEPVNKEAFVDSIAKLLHKMIISQLERGEIQYHGGVDTPNQIVEEVKETIVEEPVYIPKVGEFRGKTGETAMSFLDQLAAQGMASMKQ